VLPGSGAGLALAAGVGGLAALVIMRCVQHGAGPLMIGGVPGGDVLVAVDARPPHAGGLVEDLDRAAAALDAALDRLGQAARGGDVRAD